MVGGSRTADWAVIGWRSLAVLAALLAPFGLYTPLLGQERSPENSPVPTLNVGHSIFPLNGPWRFHTGDDFDGADPDFNDSEWETVDLTAAPGAHDWDVGLTNYVQGWTARGHTGHSGYA